MRISLSRKVRSNLRFYTIDLYHNLFGEMIIERTYGKVGAKRATGVKKEFFSSLKDAIKAFKKIESKKRKKGYELQYKKGGYEFE